MCGFVGYSSGSRELRETTQANLRAMAHHIAHRGPDDAGFWIEARGLMAFAHRRLAIIDLSPAGAQPMASSSGRFVVAYNGEIYNHLELRRALENVGAAPNSWRGHSDTETLLACFEAWGVEQTLQQSVGMFAFALWDEQNNALTLARDRFGEKPLYYGWQGQGSSSVFLFGSDLAALRAHPSFQAPVDRGALASFMRYSCIGQTQTIYEGIYKLAPGHILTLTEQDVQSRALPASQAFWSGSEMVSRAQSSLFAGSDEEAVNRLDDLLRQSISGQMLSDVPLGALLSGGIDSSAVVALMQAQSSRPVKTFTIGFHEAGFNEAEHAKAVARHLGTEHTELYVTPEQALAVIAKLPCLYSEPFADSSQIPTYLVSQLTRQHVTVALSGDAGDELFGGYNRYLLAQRWWSKLSLLPRAVRQKLAALLLSVKPHAWDRMGALAGIARMGDKTHKGAGLLGSSTVADLYRGLVSQWSDPQSVVLGSSERERESMHVLHALSGLSDAEKMMVWDMLSYLPDDILAKVDRAAMGVSLETRVPFLDHRVAEFAWSLPLNMKIRGGVGKWPLRQVLDRYVPRHLIDRPKMGFGVPIDKWLRGPLRDWAEDLLSEHRLKQEGYFEPHAIRQKWLEHLSGKRNWQHQLWNVLMFQAWQAHQRAV
jgi:asparagine synthase (glutamine-hydrolysing)